MISILAAICFIISLHLHFENRRMNKSSDLRFFLLFCNRVIMQNCVIVYLLAELTQNQEFYRNADVRPPFTYASLIRQVGHRMVNDLMFITKFFLTFYLASDETNLP